MKKYKVCLYITGCIELVLGLFLLISSIYTMVISASIPTIIEDLTQNTSASAEALATITQRIYFISSILSMLVSFTYILLGALTIFDTKNTQNSLQVNRIFGASIFEYIMFVVYFISGINYANVITLLFAILSAVTAIIKTSILHAYKKESFKKIS